MFSKFNKNKLADYISFFNYKILNLLGKNLVHHVAKYLIIRTQMYDFLEKRLNLKTPRVKKIELSYNTAMNKVNQVEADNFSKRIRHSILFQLASNAINNCEDKKIVVAECGCWKGQSAHIIGSIIKDSKIKEREFHIFDSFEGLSDYTDHDRLSANLCEEDIYNTRRAFAAQLDLVKSNLEEFDFITYHQGWIPEKFPEVKNKNFTFVNIDVDLYEPIRECLEFFYPLMTLGGIIFLDDYGFSQFPGASKAIDDFVEENNIKNFIVLPTGGAFLIK